MVVHSWLIESSNTKVISTKYFTVWVAVCVVPAHCFFCNECFNEETSGSIFWQKRELMYCFCFLINILILVTVSWWSVGLARLMIFWLFISSSVSWIDSQNCLGLWRNSFLSWCFHINKFLQEVTQFQEEQSEALLWWNHTLVHLSGNREQAHSYSPVFYQYHRPSETRLDLWLTWLTTFQLSSSTEICHILWGVDSLFHQANRPWKSHWTLHFNHLILDGIHRFISCQSCHLTIQSWNNFWKPLHSLCQSISLFEVHLLTVLESEETVTESSVELLNDSLISVDVHIPSSYPHIMHCDLTHEFMPRINLKNFWPS